MHGIPQKNKISPGVWAFAIAAPIIGTVGIFWLRSKTQELAREVDEKHRRATANYERSKKEVDELSDALRQFEERAKVTVTTTSAEYSAAFAENELAAVQRFNGRTVLITGKVQAVTTDIIKRDPVVELAGSGYLPVNAHIDESAESDAAGLKKGQQVQLKCLGEPPVAKMSQLRECTLAK